MTVIDTHAHPYFADWFPGEPEPGATHDPPESWDRISERMHGRPVDLDSFERYLDLMNDAGIEKTVVFLRDIETVTGEPPENRWVVDLAAEHDQFVPFFGVDPNKGELGARDLRHAVTEWGVKGAKIQPSAAEQYPNDETAYPIYETAADLGVPIVFHTGPGPQRERIDYAHPRHFDDIVVDFPDLSIILAHFSGPWHDEAHYLAWRYENVYVDLAFVPGVYLRQLPWDYYAETIPDSILFGTDYPLVDPAAHANRIRDLPIPDDVRQKILSENARTLLDL